MRGSVGGRGRSGGRGGREGLPHRLAYLLIPVESVPRQLCPRETLAWIPGSGQGSALSRAAWGWIPQGSANKQDDGTSPRPCRPPCPPLPLICRSSDPQILNLRSSASDPQILSLRSTDRQPQILRSTDPQPQIRSSALSSDPELRS